MKAQNVQNAHPHDSAQTHVTGASAYIDDLNEPEGCLHMALGLTQIAAGKVLSLKLDDVRKAKDVVAVYTYENIPGDGDISAIHAGDEPILCHETVLYHSQPLFAVVAKTRHAARRAARLAQAEYEETNPVITLDQAEAHGQEVTPGTQFERGDLSAGFGASTHSLKGQFDIGGQEHFYLEGQVTLAEPGEGREIKIFASTQNPTEIQTLIATLLGISAAEITVETRRLGGGFGGKETQPVIFAGLAALAAQDLKKPVKIRLDRDDDFAITGKRHDFRIHYHVGFDDDGLVHAVDATLAARAGYAADLSGPVTDRALFHADNCYYYDHVKLTSKALFTNTASNTAFRGFGGPQGVMLAETLMDDIAATLDRDPFDIRMANLYGEEGSITPYHQEVTDNIGGRMMSELAMDCDYKSRRAAIIAHNQNNPHRLKGIALTPVKFGISFTATFFNQAGAQVLVYKDGTIQVNHGGVEMGQGLNIKIKDIVARIFGVEHDKILVTATNTSKIPNTSATAASSGTDLNGKAVEDAALKIKANIAGHLANKWKVHPIDMQFSSGQINAGTNHTISWKDAVGSAYFARVPLFSSGFYKTPDIHWDRDKGQGNPFYYFAYGAACSEVEVDRLTGEYSLIRADILHDVGKSINPGIDLGQVEGAFVQGLGWLTSEELVWDQKGRLSTHAPSTYKIPLASDIPQAFHARLVDWSENQKPTIRRSKAVGEPPFCLAASAFLALKMAVRAVGDDPIVHLDAPATPERVFMAMDKRDAQS